MKRVPLRGENGFYSHAKVMRKVFLFALFLFGSVLGVQAQPNEIRSMSWGKDYKLHIGMSDDSTYIVDIKGLFHQLFAGGVRPRIRAVSEVETGFSERGR